MAWFGRKPAVSRPTVEEADAAWDRWQRAKREVSDALEAGGPHALMRRPSVSGCEEMQRVGRVTAALEEESAASRAWYALLEREKAAIREGSR